MEIDNIVLLNNLIGQGFCSLCSVRNTAVHLKLHLTESESDVIDKILRGELGSIGSCRDLLEKIRDWTVASIDTIKV